MRLLTWNCFGTPQSLLDALQEQAVSGERFQAPEVHARCANTDVLCLQELFSKEAQRLFDDLHKTHHPEALRDHNAPHLWPPTLRGTGLGLLSRPPLRAPCLWNFRSASGLDRVVRKGALHVRLQVGTAEIDVVNAHLQAGYDAAAVKVRAAQLQELRHLVDQVGSPERDLLLCGDLNIDGLRHAREGVEYRLLSSLFRDFLDLGAQADEVTFDPHPEGNELALRHEPNGWPQRLDYILHRPAAKRPVLRLRMLERVLDRPLTSSPPTGHRTAWASDHYGLLATFEAEEP
ncbi:MAG: endonuclease/exonuclease/phosphatase family protein [Myxococcales bacterium]|nr:endonuclease/exonuclease/phosphatase family protein [Polyangiaceae bacterium]MDW8247827.1 endonuclease/exonuclease/phosphatase family protein [Myxococcales bacterium]